MEEKNRFIIKKLIIHLLFWMVSVIVWSFILNPQISFAFGLFQPDTFWWIQINLIIIFFLFTLLPFVWLSKKTRRGIKIGASFTFAVVMVVLIIERAFPGTLISKLSDIAEIFFQYYFYVVIFHITIAISVYFNLNYLIDKYLSKNRFWKYMVVLASLTVVSSSINLFLFDYVIDPVFPNLYYISYLKIWETILTTAFYLILTTSVYLLWKYRLVLVAEREKSRNELAILKSQINPHFLFNNLNTIYSMASANDARTQDVILQLSDFLRYVLYDTASDEIPLEKEVETIKTYISLQKERLDPKVNQVELDIRGDFSQAAISPLLLLPLAENCFKHGIGKNESRIKIGIQFDGKTLHFRTENPVVRRDEILSSNSNGIGIKNVEKQLNLAYAGRYSLQYAEKEGMFRLELTLNLK